MLVRFVIAVLVLPFVIWGFVSTLVREIGNAFHYAYLDAGSEWETARRAWRAKSLDREDWK